MAVGCASSLPSMHSGRLFTGWATIGGRQRLYLPGFALVRHTPPRPVHVAFKRGAAAREPLGAIESTKENIATYATYEGYMPR